MQIIFVKRSPVHSFINNKIKIRVIRKLGWGVLLRPFFTVIHCQPWFKQVLTHQSVNTSQTQPRKYESITSILSFFFLKGHGMVITNSLKFIWYSCNIKSFFYYIKTFFYVALKCMLDQLKCCLLYLFGIHIMFYFYFFLSCNWMGKTLLYIGIDLTVTNYHIYIYIYSSTQFTGLSQFETGKPTLT